MATSWNSRTIPTTTWGARTAVTTSVSYDNTYVYDAALVYDAFVDGTIWTARIIP